VVGAALSLHRLATLSKQGAEAIWANKQGSKVAAGPQPRSRSAARACRRLAPCMATKPLRFVSGLA